MIDLKVEFKKYIDLANTNTDLDNYIDAQTEAAIQYFSAMIGQDLAQATFDKNVEGMESDTIFLPYSLNPVLNSIKTYEQFEPATATTISTDDYDTYIIYTRPLVTLRSYDTNIRYVFNLTNGFTDTGYPETIKQIMIEYIYIKLIESGYNPKGEKLLAKETTQTDFTGGLKSTTTLKSMVPSWEDRLTNYTIHDTNNI